MVLRLIYSPQSYIKSIYDNVNLGHKKNMEDMSVANLIGMAQTLMSTWANK